MEDDREKTLPTDPADAEPPQRALADLSPAAQRALQEAEARRQAKAAEKAQQPREIGGRGGEDPARYGDWEVKGLAIDF